MQKPLGGFIIVRTSLFFEREKHPHTRALMPYIYTLPTSYLIESA